MVVDQAKARFNAQQNAQKSNESLGNAMQGQVPMASSSQSHPGPPVGLGGIGLGASQAQTAAARAGKPSGGVYSQPSPSPQVQVNSPGLTNIPPPTNGSSAIAHAAPTANGGPVPGKGA
jgi:hypothetical protein